MLIRNIFHGSFAKALLPIAWAISLMMIRNRKREADQSPYGHVEREGILFNKYLALPVYIDYQGNTYTRDTRTKRERERRRLFVRRSSSSIAKSDRFTIVSSAECCGLSNGCCFSCAIWPSTMTTSHAILYSSLRHMGPCLFGFSIFDRP